MDDKPDIQEQLQEMKMFYKEHLALEYERDENMIILQEFKPDKNFSYDEQYLRDEITAVQIQENEQKLNNKKFQRLTEQLETLSISKNKENDNYFKKYEKQITFEKLAERIKGYQSKVSQLEQDNKVISNEIEQIKEFTRYNLLQHECDKLSEKIETLLVQGENTRSSLKNAELLKSLIQRAESIAITNIIQSINTFAQTYLEIFFTENPITVSIKAFKNVKKRSKAQINIVVQYKGVECDLMSLSGGELQRVLLAFTLALAEMYQAPFLLLDESTSNLDQELTEIVVDGLKAYSGNLIILIAHQVVKGKFDHVIKL